MSARALGILMAVVSACGPVAALAGSLEALEWLRKIQTATQSLSYTGTFVYQQGGRSETSRITRYASGDIEKIEVMDGVPREIVRTRDSVRCYLPHSRVVKVERRSAEREFPALLPDRIAALARHYDIDLGESRRVAGYECRAVVLTPKDNLRYGYRLYADVRSGMLLKAITFDAAGQQVEQIMFTQLSLGNVQRDMVRPKHATHAWRIEDAGVVPARLAGWQLSAELPGFHKIVELKRRLGESRPVGQVVYSDGMAAISVFIEPLEGRREGVQPGLSSMGALHMVTREVANHAITVVGEAPALSVQRIADAVEYRRPPQ